MYICVCKNTVADQGAKDAWDGKYENVLFLLMILNNV
jgi:bacterioferritin-associated ferredoxin